MTLKTFQTSWFFWNHFSRSLGELFSPLELGAPICSIHQAPPKMGTHLILYKLRKNLFEEKIFKRPHFFVRGLFFFQGPMACVLPAAMRFCKFIWKLITAVVKTPKLPFSTLGSCHDMRWPQHQEDLFGNHQGWDVSLLMDLKDLYSSIACDLAQNLQSAFFHGIQDILIYNILICIIYKWYMHEYSYDFVRRGKFQNPFTRSLQRNSFHFWGMLGICRSFLG